MYLTWSTRIILFTWVFSAVDCADIHARSNFVNGPWSLAQHGMSGVAGMQLAIVSETKAIFYDKVEHNPINNSAGVPAWSVEYDITNDNVRALNPKTNSFCAAGAHLSNGTLVNTGGNPVVLTGDSNGIQGIRLFTPCNTGNCDVFEDPANIHLTSPRWYPSASRLDDGSVMILGGSIGGGFIDSAGINNPTYEFFPPKNINGFNGTRIPSQFLKDTLNANHFPIMMVLPDGTLFVAANTQCMIFNWRTNVETRLPGIPNGVRVTSPFSAAAVLLPLTPANSYTPEVLICGGSTLSDTASPSTFSSQAPTSAQCARMVLNTAGIAAGWQVETMPQQRIMGEAILLPDKRVLIINGAQTGVAGYRNVADQIGQSNADNPAFQGLLYDPAAPAGSRFSQQDLPVSTIPRIYHSVATLTPNASIMIAGSNPNLDVQTRKYPTEYRVEWLSPSYLNSPRPSYTGLPPTLNYGLTFTLVVTLPPNTANLTVSLMDLGFATHAVHMDQRLVQLVSSMGPVAGNTAVLTIQAPPNGMIYPPGPGYLYVVTDTGVPSFGSQVMVGTGASPPVDNGALVNLKAVVKAQASAMASSVQAAVPTSGEGSEYWY